MPSEALHKQRKRMSEIINNLKQDHSWEQAINLNINKLGMNKIEFILYDNSNTDPSDTLHIWVEIKNSEEV